MKMEMNQMRLLVFLLAFHQMRCLASDNIMCLTKKCLAAAAVAKQLQQDQQITSTAKSPTTENDGINFDSSQTQQINRFSTEILFVSDLNPAISNFSFTHFIGIIFDCSLFFSFQVIF